MITLNIRTKEAIKTALAMTIAYAIALRMDWDRPYWAAFAVGMISLPAAGASLRKGVLRMLRRFFRQAEFLVSPPSLSLGQTTAAAGWWERLRYRNDLLVIPDELGTWGAMVDQRKYVGGSPEQLPMLATRLHMLGHRLQELFEARRSPRAQFLVDELSEDIRNWRFKIQEIFQYLFTALVFLIAVSVVAIKYWDYVTNPWTRDGQVRAQVIQITPRVSGPLVKLPVKDNQFVKAGDLLFKIDPRAGGCAGFYHLLLRAGRISLLYRRSCWI